MREYLVPAGGAETEFTEKRSRFLGHIVPVETEEEARAYIERMKKTYHDARHNCWCYRLREGGVERCADDGEPQGTAGQPMLNVFQREGVENLCCVVTRYFGGVLLGAGGLTRAYAKSARDTLDAAGLAVARRWVEVSMTLPYHLYERVRLEVEGVRGILGETEYAAEITLRALLPEGGVGDLTRRVTDLTGGAVTVQVTGEVCRTAPISC